MKNRVPLSALLFVYLLLAALLWLAALVPAFAQTPVFTAIGFKANGQLSAGAGAISLSDPAFSGPLPAADLPASLALATGKTFTLSNTVTLAGTDGSTLNIGTGGTLSSAAFGVAGSVTDAMLATTNKPSVALVATSNITLSGAQTIDGISTGGGGPIVLATAQTIASQNGPWVSGTGAWTRPAWYSSGSTTQAPQFSTVFATLGTAYQGSVWLMTTGGVTIDTTAANWLQIPSSALITETSRATAAEATKQSTLTTGSVPDQLLANAAKPSVAVVATSNLTLSAEQTIDGFTTNGSLVLATAQTTASQNGPWLSGTGAWTRPTWYTSGSTTQAPRYAQINVRLGTQYQGTSWRLETAGVTIDTTAATWVQTPVSAFAQPETLGTKLRRLAKLNGDGNNPKDRSYMKAVRPWQPSTAWGVYDVCVNGGLQYVCSVAGTSASSGGPTTTIAATPTTDGSVTWLEYGTNSVTTDPSLTQTAWAASTAYTLNQQVLSGGNVYACVQAGTSTTTTLSGTGNAITDGGAKWTYLGVYQANPYANVFPAVTIASGSTVSGLTNIYGSDTGSFTALGAEAINGGTGYVVGDTVIPTGGSSAGTYTIQTVLTVTSVSSGSVTGLAVSTPGQYSVLPGTTFPLAQASTSGSGTGCTFAIRWSDGLPHMSVRNSYLAYQQSAGFAGMYTFTPSLNSTPIRQHPAADFYTDAPAFYFTATAEAGQCVVIDGVRYNQDSFTAFTGNHTIKFDFTNTGGRKKRHILIQSVNYTTFAYVGVDSNSQVWKPDPADNLTGVLISDSTFAGSGYGPFLPGNCVDHNLSNELGWSNLYDFSLGGTGYCNRGTSPGAGTDVYGTRIAEAVALNPQFILFAGSVNDRGSSYTNAQITAAAQADYQLCRTLGFKGPIFVVGCWSINDTGSTVTLANVESDLQAAIAALSDPLIFFIPVRNATPLPWITGTWNNTANTNSTNATNYVNTVDNTHPPDIGTRYYAARIAQGVRACLPAIP